MQNVATREISILDFAVNKMTLRLCKQIADATGQQPPAMNR
jgi:hypothetical protein